MRRYLAMLLARPPEDRLKMACSMSATARALARAGILAESPQASPGAVRRGLFLRFYGREFSAEERERISNRLEGREAQASDSPRRVPVNWDDLETALSSNADEWTSYLDLRTGEVQTMPFAHWDDEDDWPSPEDIDDGLAAGHLLAIEPLGARVEYTWMADFAATVTDGRLRDRLDIALDGRGAFRRFKNALRDHPAERERWFAFRDERLRAAAQEWLIDHEIEPTTNPPARR
jgi:hypothetical protein